MIKSKGAGQFRRLDALAIVHSRLARVRMRRSRGRRSGPPRRAVGGDRGPGRAGPVTASRTVIQSQIAHKRRNCLVVFRGIGQLRMVSERALRRQTRRAREQRAGFLDNAGRMSWGWNGRRRGGDLWVGEWTGQSGRHLHRTGRELGAGRKLRAGRQLLGTGGKWWRCGGVVNKSMHAEISGH